MTTVFCLFGVLAFLQRESSQNKARHKFTRHLLYDQTCEVEFIGFLMNIWYCIVYSTILQEVPEFRLFYVTMCLVSFTQIIYQKFVRRTPNSTFRKR